MDGQKSSVPTHYKGDPLQIRREVLHPAEHKFNVNRATPRQAPSSTAPAAAFMRSENWFTIRGGTFAGSNMQVRHGCSFPFGAVGIGGLEELLTLHEEDSVPTAPRSSSSTNVWVLHVCMIWVR